MASSGCCVAAAYGDTLSTFFPVTSSSSAAAAAYDGGDAASPDVDSFYAEPDPGRVEREHGGPPTATDPAAGAPLHATEPDMSPGSKHSPFEAFLQPANDASSAAGLPPYSNPMGEGDDDDDDDDDDGEDGGDAVSGAPANDGAPAPGGAEQDEEVEEEEEEEEQQQQRRQGAAKTEQDEREHFRRLIEGGLEALERGWRRGELVVRPASDGYGQPRRGMTPKDLHDLSKHVCGLNASASVRLTTFELMLDVKSSTNVADFEAGLSGLGDLLRKHSKSLRRLSLGKRGSGQPPATARGAKRCPDPYAAFLADVLFPPEATVEELEATVEELEAASAAHAADSETREGALAAAYRQKLQKYLPVLEHLELRSFSLDTDTAGSRCSTEEERRRCRLLQLQAEIVAAVARLPSVVSLGLEKCSGRLFTELLVGREAKAHGAGEEGGLASRKAGLVALKVAEPLCPPASRDGCLAGICALVAGSGGSLRSLALEALQFEREGHVEELARALGVQRELRELSCRRVAFGRRAGGLNARDAQLEGCLGVLYSALGALRLEGFELQSGQSDTSCSSHIRLLGEFVAVPGNTALKRIALGGLLPAPSAASVPAVAGLLRALLRRAGGVQLDLSRATNGKAFARTIQAALDPAPGKAREAVGPSRCVVRVTPPEGLAGDAAFRKVASLLETAGRQGVSLAADPPVPPLVRRRGKRPVEGSRSATPATAAKKRRAAGAARSEATPAARRRPWARQPSDEGGGQEAGEDEGGGRSPGATPAAATKKRRAASAALLGATPAPARRGEPAAADEDEEGEEGGGSPVPLSTPAPGAGRACGEADADSDTDTDTDAEAATPPPAPSFEPAPPFFSVGSRAAAEGSLEPDVHADVDGGGAAAPPALPAVAAMEAVDGEEAPLALAVAGSVEAVGQGWADEESDNSSSFPSPSDAAPATAIVAVGSSSSSDAIETRFIESSRFLLASKAEAEADVKRLQDENAKLKAQVKAAEHKQTHLQDELHGLKHGLGNAEARATALARQLKFREDELAREKQFNKEKEEARSGLAADQTRLQNEAIAAAAEQARLRRKVDELRKQLTDAGAEAASLREAVARAGVNLESEKRLREEAERKLAAAEGGRATLEAALAGEKGKREAAEAAAAEEQRQRGAAEAAAAEERRQRGAAEAAAAEQAAETTRLEKEIKGLKEKAAEDLKEAAKFLSATRDVIMAMHAQ